MNITITQEQPDSAAASALIRELDALLMPLYPPASRHGYSVDKLIDEAVTFFVLRDDDAPVGCGALKFSGHEYGEVKRMYVRPAFTGRGFAKAMLTHLIEHTRSHGAPLVRLETGIHQYAAIGLYERMGFRRIAPFGPYSDDPNSLCYELFIG